MSGYRDDLRAAHERIASLQRDADDTRKRAKDEAAAAFNRIEQLERQVAMLERDDAESALRERIERVEREASETEARDKGELDAATMKILALEEAAHQQTKEYDRAFARIGQLEDQLAKANQNKGELDAATMKILALEEAALKVVDLEPDAVKAEFDEVRADLFEAKRELVDVRRELEEKVDALSKRDEEVEQLRDRVGYPARALDALKSRGRASRESSRRRSDRSGAEPEAPSTAIQPIQQIDDDLARLSPAGNWKLVYRLPKAMRSRRRQRLAFGGFLVMLVGLLLATQGPSVLGAIVLVAGALAIAISMIAGPSVLRGTIEHVRNDASDGRYIVARIEGADVQLPRDAEPVITSGKKAIVERGTLGEGTLVVLTAAEQDDDVVPSAMG